LLSTPPHGDAVTFGYRERASPGGDLHPLIAPASRRTDPRLRGDDDHKLARRESLDSGKKKEGGREAAFAIQEEELHAGTLR